MGGVTGGADNLAILGKGEELRNDDLVGRQNIGFMSVQNPYLPA
jgi:hypothetical protein